MICWGFWWVLTDSHCVVNCRNAFKLIWYGFCTFRFLVNINSLSDDFNPNKLSMIWIEFKSSDILQNLALPMFISELEYWTIWNLKLESLDFWKFKVGVWNCGFVKKSIVFLSRIWVLRCCYQIKGWHAAFRTEENKQYGPFQGNWNRVCTHNSCSV